MSRGFGSVANSEVCRCEKPCISIIGYSRGELRSTPIYRCFNCGAQFKSNSEKWKVLHTKALKELKGEEK